MEQSSENTLDEALDGHDESASRTKESSRKPSSVIVADEYQELPEYNVLPMSLEKLSETAGSEMDKISLADDENVLSPIELMRKMSSVNLSTERRSSRRESVLEEDLMSDPFQI